MKKAIFPIEVELGYETIEERDKKVNIIKDLLTEIIKSKDKYNDIKKLNKYLSIIKGEKLPRSYYIINISLSLIFVTLISIIILGINIHNNHLVASIYLGGDSGYGYYLVNSKGTEKLEYGIFDIYGCNDIACNTNKGIVLRRYIDYYSIF